MTPSMDQAGLDCFKRTLQSSQCYLEYGCGGSTVYAANTAKIKNIISIESDIDWVKQISNMLANSNLLLEHCDIGPVKEWGFPKTKDQVENFWKYAIRPWQVAQQHNLVPDAVLIDGRFRVASFLYSLMCAKQGVTILFDDFYEPRPHYFVVEEFLPVKERQGRMAVFQVQKNYSVEKLTAKIAEYLLDPR
jgi:hypothetical protein